MPTQVPPAGELLVRGVRWSSQGPALSLTGDDGAAASVPLLPGDWLRLRVHAAARRCLGYTRVLGPEASEHVPCVQRSDAERGYQCGPCFARDDFRFMHDFHRSGIAPAGLKAYLAQPHWLYVATFADGTTKVGTASQRSKSSRLAEQGALCASYVARAANGSVVRVLEDAVTQALGLSQFVRARAKFTALLTPRPAAELAAHNHAQAAAVRDFLDTVAVPGFAVVQEQWQPQASAAPVAAPSPRLAYPHPLDDGEHGWQLLAVLGSFALVRVDAAEPVFLLDLAALRGRAITLGAYRSELPPVQESLF